MPKRFQDTYNNVDRNSNIDENHKITGTKLRIIATLTKSKREFLELLLTATYFRSESMRTRTHC